MPTIAEFAPILGTIRAGDLAGRINGRKHDIFPPQASHMQQLPDADLIRFRTDDPISGHARNGGFAITGGHHRLHEIIRRVRSEELPADTPVRILFRD